MFLGGYCTGLLGATGYTYLSRVYCRSGRGCWLLLYGAAVKNTKHVLSRISLRKSSLSLQTGNYRSVHLFLLLRQGASGCISFAGRAYRHRQKQGGSPFSSPPQSQEINRVTTEGGEEEERGRCKEGRSKGCACLRRWY